MRIAICIITYRRPSSLMRLLASLQDLVLPAEPADVRVIVVDNDTGEAGRPVCEEANRWLQFPLHYAVEKHRGIPQARNAALGIALGHCDAIAFIDDDAIPSPTWLTELLRAKRDFGADAATGPSRARFDEPPPRWALASGLFDVPEHADGTRRPVAYTGNVLLCATALASMPELFDEEMALCGGSDAEFFGRFSDAGHPIVWAADAVTFECVPSSRATLRWILRRGFRTGNAATYVQRKRDPGFANAIRVMCHGLYCSAKGSALLALALSRGSAEAVKAAYLVAYGLGRGMALLGLRVNEYKVIHGG